MNAIDLLVNRVVVARKWTQTLLNDIEETRWFDAPAPGVQHVAWQVGHLAASQTALMHFRCFGKKPEEHVPAGFIAQFGRGSTPKAERSAYPPLPEIRVIFDRIQEETIALMKSISPAELSAPTNGDPHPMFENKGQCFAMVAMHEAFHAGQIALTRRIFGKSPLR